jgi:hypothetical protein
MSDNRKLFLFRGQLHGGNANVTDYRCKGLEEEVMGTDKGKTVGKKQRKTVNQKKEKDRETYVRNYLENNKFQSM